MTYDWYAKLHGELNDSDVSQGIQTGEVLQHRQKLTLHVHGENAGQTVFHPTNTDRNRNPESLGSRKDLAKEQVKRCLNLTKDGSLCAPHHAFTTEPLGRQGMVFQIKWKLATPFFSRADLELDAADNPICRDTLSGQPILRASGAKGMLAHRLRATDAQMSDFLLGPEVSPGETHEGFCGRLVFGDVLFDKVDLDVFSPHERIRGVADHPVTFEVVPAGATAEWSIAFWERVPGELDSEAARKILGTVFNSLSELLQDFGFSAKRTSGYGLANMQSLEVRACFGEAIQIPSRFLDTKAGEPFAEAPPSMSARQGQSLGEWHKVLIKDGKMAVERTQALEALVNAEASKKGLTKPKQLANLQKSWSKKDKAGKTWDEAKAFLEAQTPESQEQLAREKEAYTAWEQRKQAHETRQPKVYLFTPLNALFEAIETLEVKS